MAEKPWSKIREFRLSDGRPDEWPDGVYAISTDGLDLLGIHEKTDKLYWDGKEIVTRSVVRLGSFELWLASIATLAGVGMLVLEVGKIIGWWGSTISTLTTGWDCFIKLL